MKKYMYIIVIIMCLVFNYKLNALNFETGSFFNEKNYNNEDFYDNLSEEKRIQSKFQEYIVASSLKGFLIKLQQDDVLKYNFQYYDTAKYVNMKRCKMKEFKDIENCFFLIVEEIDFKQRPVYIIHVVKNEVSEVGEFIYDYNDRKESGLFIKYINFVNLRPKPQWSFGIHSTKLEYQLCVIKNTEIKSDAITYLYSGGVPVCYYITESNNITKETKIRSYRIDSIFDKNPMYEINFNNKIPINAIIYSIKEPNLYEAERDYTYWPGFGEMMNIYSNIERIVQNRYNDKINIYIDGFHKNNYNDNKFAFNPIKSVIKIDDKIIAEIKTDNKYIEKYGWFPDLEIKSELFNFKRERISDDGEKYKYKYKYEINKIITEKIVEYKYNEVSYISNKYYKGYDNELFKYFVELNKLYGDKSVQ